jgi:hypothetical protein
MNTDGVLYPKDGVEWHGKGRVEEWDFAFGDTARVAVTSG